MDPASVQPSRSPKWALWACAGVTLALGGWVLYPILVLRPVAVGLCGLPVLLLSVATLLGLIGLLTHQGIGRGPPATEPLLCR